MIKKLLGLILFVASIAVIIVVTLRRDNFRSMTSWSGFQLHRPIEQPHDQAPASAAEPVQEPSAPAALPAVDSPATSPAEADSLTATKSPKETSEPPVS